MRRRARAALLLLFACGSEQAVELVPEAGPPLDTADAAAVDAAPDVVTVDAGADATVDASAEGGSSLCRGLDAATVLVCETFDRAAAVPLPFSAEAGAGGTLEVGSVRALSLPNALRAGFRDGGDLSSAAGTALRAVFSNGLPRARLSFAVRLDGTWGGEVDVAQLTWASPSGTYWFRFGSNGGNFWTFESTGYGYTSFSAFPTNAWYRVVIEIDLAAKRFTANVGGAEVFDQFLSPPAAIQPNAIELALGIPAIAAIVTTASAVFVDDVTLTSY